MLRWHVRQCHCTADLFSKENASSSLRPFLPWLHCVEDSWRQVRWLQFMQNALTCIRLIKSAGFTHEQKHCVLKRFWSPQYIQLLKCLIIIKAVSALTALCWRSVVADTLTAVHAECTNIHQISEISLHFIHEQKYLLRERWQIQRPLTSILMGFMCFKQSLQSLHLTASVMASIIDEEECRAEQLKIQTMLKRLWGLHPHR